jgi:superfamily II DNA or RNA helicase
MPTYNIRILDEVNIKLEGLPPDVRRRLANKLKFEVPYARHTPQFKLGRWDGMKGYFGIGGYGYLNHLDVLMAEATEQGYSVNEIFDERHPCELTFESIDENYWGDRVWPAGHRAEGEKVVLRDYQVQAINNFISEPQSLQQIATGAGKTLLTATMSRICEPFGRSIVVVPNKSLVVQTEADYINLGLDVGVYFGDRKELGRTHTICTWQSLNILDKRNADGKSVLSLAEFLDGVACVIIDEVHQAKADVLTRLLTNNLKNAPIRWGLTGTVPKEDFEFQGILAAIGPVVGNITAHELQEKGVLAKLHINVVQMVDITAYSNYQEELKYLVTNQKRLEYLAKLIRNISKTGNTVVLVDRIATGQVLKDLIPDATFVSGSMKVLDRQDEYQEINDADGKTVIATYGVAAVGLNIPRIFNLVLIEPGKSFVRVIQSIGRGVRTAKDKDSVNIWDITSTCKFAKRHLRERKKFYNDAKYPFKIEKVDWTK